MIISGREAILYYKEIFNIVPKPKVVAIFVAYNAAKTLRSFYKTFPKEQVDEIILVDDASRDETYEIAKSLNITAYKNITNLGYGGNMKRALALALKRNADIVIDIHPDGEYDTSAIPLALEKIKNGADLVLGNRFAESAISPIHSGMFVWKLIPIMFLNWLDKRILKVPVNDLHQGFRTYSKRCLQTVNFEANSDNYLFSFEIISQAAYCGMHITEVPVSTNYTGDKRGASLKNSIQYSLGTFKILILYILAKILYPSKIFRGKDSI